MWPLAYFLRAKLYYASKLNKSRPGILKDTVDFVDKVLCRHYQELMHSPWKSLPELTNSNGTVSAHWAVQFSVCLEFVCLREEVHW